VIIQAADLFTLRGLIKVDARLKVMTSDVLEGRELEAFIIRLVAFPDKEEEQFPLQLAPELENATSEGRSI
jgi:hypothetical protein